MSEHMVPVTTVLPGFATTEMVRPTEHIPIPGPVEGSPEWQESHDKMLTIGASDAAAACNRSSYRTSLDLYLRATGEAPSQVFDEPTLKRMRRGRRLQPVILKEYADETGHEVIENLQMFIHPRFDFCSATPDGIVLDSPRFGAEVKASNPRMFSTIEDDAKYGEEGTDWVPDDVLFQTQQQMAVMGWAKVDVVVMFGVFTMRVYTVPRSDELIDGIIEAEQELMQRISDRNPPEPNWTHPKTKQLIQAINGLDANSVVELSLEDANEWLAYTKLGQDIKKAEAQRDASRNKLLWALGSAELGRFPYGDKELRRVVVTESLYTQEDVEEVLMKVGQVKRKRYERLIERKIK